MRCALDLGLRLKSGAIIFSISFATSVFAESAQEFRFLPEEQAIAMQSALETGARLKPYDKQFLFWMGLNIIAPDCGVSSDEERQKVEFLMAETASLSLLEDPESAVQAQFDVPSHILSVAASDNPCNTENQKNSRKFLDDLFKIFEDDNKKALAGILPDAVDSSDAPSEQLSAPLHKSKIVTLGSPSVDLLCVSGSTDGSEVVCKKVFDLIKLKKFKTITCSYGPFDEDGTGFEVYKFWYDSAPENLDEYEFPGNPHPFNRLGSAAVTDCPVDSSAAKQFLSENSL